MSNDKAHSTQFKWSGFPFVIPKMYLQYVMLNEEKVIIDYVLIVFFG